MQIENEWLRVTFKNEGAEFTSLIDKKTQTEFAWQGEANVWAGRNPTLFPVVGKCWQEKYRDGGKTFTLGNHGFARRSDFAKVEATDNSLTLQLTDNDETRKVYPFHFRLTNHYQLEENNLQITITVENTDEKNLPFSVGAHPAFNCPLLPTEVFADYKIVFEKSENLKRLKMNPDSSFQKERINYGENIKEINLSRSLFKDDALVFENLKSAWVRLQGPQHKITVSTAEAPWFGIWTKGDFLCLEPWFGHGDFSGYSAEFSEREGMIILPPKTQFEFNYQITID